MEFNFLSQAVRSLRSQKGFAALNFLGLSVALTVALLTGLLVFHERSFDNFHHDGERLFRVVTQMDSPGEATEKMAGVPKPLPPAVRTELPGLGQFTEVVFHEKDLVRLSPERFFEEKNLVFVDTAFFSLFNFETKTGNARAALGQPNMVLLTETTAAKYFPSENAVGKKLKIEAGDCPVQDFEVAGIVADAPPNSHLPFTMLVSAASRKKADPLANWGWFEGGQYFYAKPAANVSAAQIGDQISALANARKGKGDPSHYKYALQPLAEIHSDLDFADGNAAYTADFGQFYWLGAIALFLLLIAAVNYVNLSTAIAHRKAHEVGVRKTLGATRWQLASRFWFETFLVVGGAVLAAAAAANFLLPFLNQFLDRNITAHWFSAPMLGFMAALAGLTTLAAGLYPALVMAGFSPVQAFRGRFSSTGKQTSLTLRRGLVTFQFVVAQVFIVAVIVAAVQMDFIRSKPLGFRHAGVVDLRLPDAKPEQISTFRSAVAGISGVLSTSYCLGGPTSRNGFTTRFNRPELYGQQKLSVAIKIADPEYLETYGLELLAGRFLNASDMAQSAENVPETERKYVCVLNETAVKSLGFASPEAVLGQTVRTGANNMNPVVVGVLRDFHTSSLREPLESVAVLPFHDMKNALGIRLDPAAANAATLSKIESAWKTVFPGDIFSAAFMDDYLASLYRDEGRIFLMFKLVALLALLINALGLIGLTAFMVEAKTKEIGIRKVLGTSVAGITGLLAKDFLKLVVVAIIIASPVAYFFMQRWLADFAYRIDIQWWMFAAAGIAAISIAFLTVSFQSVRAALANPVKSLRSE